MATAVRKIIDSNMLTSPDLNLYLKSSASNFALICEYAAMEAYRCDNITGIFNSMKILTRFPSQIIVLKNTINICGLNGKLKGLQNRLISQSQTQDFRKFSKQLQQAKSGDQQLRLELFHLSKKATESIDKIIADARAMRPAFDELSRTYSKEERSLLRADIQLSPVIFDRLMYHTMEIAATLFAKHPRVTTLPSYPELLNTFIFRLSLCMYLLGLDWGVKGGVTGTHPSKIRNDLIDMHFVAYATFFDGFLSADKKAMRFYELTKSILSILLRSGCQ